jgi:hypothetical protein
MMNHMKENKSYFFKKMGKCRSFSFPPPIIISFLV